MSQVIIYDADLNKVAILPKAYKISYELRANEVGRASFSVPIDDEHVDEITQRRYAEIYDGDRRIDLFRIVKLVKKEDELSVSCEHVLATLRDTEINETLYGSAGTATAINEVLAEQTVSHWQLGTCDFDELFLYEWPRGTTLLKALLSIPEKFQSGYFWTFDTTSHPWTLNLIEPPTVVTAYIDYGRNMKSIERMEDASGLVTKLYPHGAKAGEDQIGISSVEPSGNDYIENYSYTTEVITRHWTDQSYETEQELYDAAVALLDKLSQPKYTYRVTAADLYKITGESIDKFEIGALVKVSNPEMDIDADVRVMSITKNDLTGKPGEITLELANKGEEFDLSEKVKTNDLSGIDINDIPGGTPGALPAPPSSAGLVITTDHLGYTDGSSWKTYMDDAGRLWADNGTNWFHWDPSASPALEIKGSVTITGGTGIGNLSDAGALATLDVVGTAQIQDAAITEAKIHNLAVTSAKIDDAAIIEAKIENLAVTNIKLSGEITYDKIQSISLDSVVTGTLTSDFIIINNDINFHPGSTWHSIMGCAYMEGYHSGSHIHSLQLGSSSSADIKLSTGVGSYLTLSPTADAILYAEGDLTLNSGSGNIWFKGLSGSDVRMELASTATGHCNYSGGYIRLYLPDYGVYRNIKLWAD